MSNTTPPCFLDLQGPRGWASHRGGGGGEEGRGWLKISTSSKRSTHYLNDTNRFDVSSKGPSKATLIPD